MNGYQIKRIEGLRRQIRNNKLVGFELTFAESMVDKLDNEEYELSDKQNTVLNQLCERYRC